MGDNINVGGVQSGNTVIGGQGATVSGPGTVNVNAAPGDYPGQLRDLLDELLKAIAASAVPPEVLNSAELARAEATKAKPQPARLRQLMDAVISGAGNAAAITHAALNVMGVIDALGKAVS
jgi:anti-sigma factor RsiW